MSFDISTLTVDTTTAPQAMIRRLPNGTYDLVEPDEQERETRVVPQAGMYRLKFTGFTEPFTVDDAFNPGQIKTVARFEFTVLRGKNLTGRHFSNRWTWSFGERATLGQFARKLFGGDLPAQFNIASLLDREFDVMVNPDNKDKYAPVVIASILVDDEPEDASQPASRDQITAILAAATAVYGDEAVAKAKIRAYIKGAFNASSSAGLTYDQADTAQNFLETTPHDDIKAKIEELALAEYAEVPF